MVILRKFQQLLQIKIGGNDTRTAFFGIICITVLFYMGRNHQNRLA